MRRSATSSSASRPQEVPRRLRRGDAGRAARLRARGQALPHPGGGLHGRQAPQRRDRRAAGRAARRDRGRRPAGAQGSGARVRAVPGLRAVALGGGHGLHASLSALRRVSGTLTAVVTVADDGGSSGRLRRELGVLPPGDLRMALAALCGDDDWGTTWSRVVQHRFGGDCELAGHALGNLLIVTLWELLGDTVEGLDWVGRLLGTRGRVLPMASVPLDIVAEVEGADPDRPDEISRVRGQHACAATPGRVRSISLLPDAPPAVPAAVEAVLEADWVVFGPG